MGNSDSWKPDSRQPVGNSAPADPAAATSKPTPPAADATKGNSAGRVIHDERGNAVWDWVKDTARIAIDSTSRLLMRLDVPELTMEDTREQEPFRESERDPGGGYDPYGGSGSRARGTTFKNVNTKDSARSGSSNNAGGGYDPYGKGLTNKPTRKP